MRTFLLLIVVLTYSCNDQAETAPDSEDTIAKTLNKSEIINDSTRLPKDSANTGVQH